MICKVQLTFVNGEAALPHQSLISIYVHSMSLMLLNKPLPPPSEMQSISGIAAPVTAEALPLST
jgi:hypothetical protein